MKPEDNILVKIHQFFGGTLNLLEEQINLEVQSEYIKCSNKLCKEFNAEDIIKKSDDIFKNNIDIEDKKYILIQLAATGSIEAYRTIEKFLRLHDKRLHEWATLALHESKLLIQSRILDENQILITSALGGAGMKLRYFVVFFNRCRKSFTGLQKQIVQKELKFRLKKIDGNLEQFEFNKGLCRYTVLIPLNVYLTQMFDSVVDECNQYGNFLFRKYLLTNIKILSIDEIEEFYTLYQNQFT